MGRLTACQPCRRRIVAISDDFRQVTESEVLGHQRVVIGMEVLSGQRRVTEIDRGPR